MPRIIIVGKGGSGKDTLLSRYVKAGFTRSISFTTRPMRDGEVNGKDYHFISQEQFEDMLKLELFHEHDCFNGWYYGTHKGDWINCTLFIKTPKGVAQISEEERKDCFIIYLDIDMETRMKRLCKRQDSDSAVRRINADGKDFEKFTDYDFHVTNPFF